MNKSVLTDNCNFKLVYLLFNKTAATCNNKIIIVNTNKRISPNNPSTVTNNETDKNNNALRCGGGVVRGDRLAADSIIGIITIIRTRAFGEINLKITGNTFIMPIIIFYSYVIIP